MKIEERQVELDAVMEEIFGENWNKPKPLAEPRESQMPPDYDREERLKKAMKDEKFKRLYGGDWTGYSSQSEADQAFCNLLAFWLENDAERMDRVFRLSELYRPKWDAQRGSKTYGELTISKALEGNPVTFSDQHSSAHEDFKKITAFKPYSLGIVEAGEFVKITLPERKNIIAPWLKESSYGLLVAPRGAGKTWFAASIVDALTRGGSFGPWATENAVNALYCESEMAAQDVQQRFQTLNPSNGRRSRLYIYSEGYASLVGAKRGNLLDSDWREFMEGYLIEKNIGLWVVDNLSSLSPGIDENSKRDWDVINQWFIALRFAGVASILIHHTGKSGDQRGTSGREDNLDYVITLKTPTGYAPEEGARFIVHFSKSRVSNRDLPLIADTEFQMTQDESGEANWTFSKVKTQNKNEVIRLLNIGTTHRDIAGEIGISVGQVSKIRTQAFKDGYINENGKLTDLGALHLAT
jgi:hypothetical protein